jgi:translation initiation factor 1
MANSNTNSRTVYTTESGRICPECGLPVAQCRCKKGAVRPQPDGIVRVLLEKKGRAGKTVSVITGLPGSDEDLKQLAADLKRRCGTGGTIKDGLIEIQGDHRDTLLEMLKARGFKAKRVGG